MNLYLVISEELVSYGPTGGFEPPEWYRIAELVVAQSHSQARWLAWKADGGLRGSYNGDLCEMPKFTCQLKVRDYDDGPARALPYESSCHMPHWDSKAAPHIGLEADIVEEVPA